MKLPILTAAILFAAGAAHAGAMSSSGTWAANDPFVGKWTLNVPRSTIVDQMAVEAAGPNRFTFRFEGGPAETVLADGTDQPGIPGTTLAVRVQDSRTLKIVRKQSGRVVVSATWKISEDGRILHDTFTAAQTNRPAITTNYAYRRMSGGSGFSGTWESTTRPLGLIVELQIQPYGGRGLSFVSPGSVKNVIFDGQDHAVGGVAKGIVASGRRRSERAMEYTEKNGGKVIDTRKLALSSDDKTLTIHVDKAGQATPTVLVFARE